MGICRELCHDQLRHRFGITIFLSLIKIILLADEYFAEGLMSYFDVQYPYDPAAPATREQLYSMDPMFYSFIDRWMYHNDWRGGCPVSVK